MLLGLPCVYCKLCICFYLSRLVFSFLTFSVGRSHKIWGREPLSLWQLATPPIFSIQSMLFSSIAMVFSPFLFPFFHFLLVCVLWSYTYTLKKKIANFRGYMEGRHTDWRRSADAWFAEIQGKLAKKLLGEVYLTTFNNFILFYCTGSQGKKLVFVTNNSTKSRRQYATKFHSLGISVSEVLNFSFWFSFFGWFGFVYSNSNILLMLTYGDRMRSSPPLSQPQCT